MPTTNLLTSTLGEVFTTNTVKWFIKIHKATQQDHYMVQKIHFLNIQLKVKKGIPWTKKTFCSYARTPMHFLPNFHYYAPQFGGFSVEI